jgi:hypothetical protein
VEIDLRVGGVPVTMHSCSTCETRWWDYEGQQVRLGDVLGLATAEVAGADAVPPLVPARR